MDDEFKNLASKIEAILFVAGEPLSFERLAKITGKDAGQIKSALSGLAGELEEGKRGLRLVMADESAQLVTAPEFSSLIEDLFKSELKEELTPASLETLAIVAYKGPIKRADIDFIRGVNSSYTLRNLLLRGLIEREGSEADGRAFEYRISFEFLRRLGLKSREALPDYEKITQVLDPGGEHLKEAENKVE